MVKKEAEHPVSMATHQLLRVLCIPSVLKENGRLVSFFYQFELTHYNIVKHPCEYFVQNVCFILFQYQVRGSLPKNVCLKVMTQPSISQNSS